MKYIWIPVAVLLIASLVLPAALGWGLPELDGVEPVLAVAEDGSVFLTENRSVFSYIYTISPEGQVSSVYRERAAGSPRVTQLAAGDGFLWYVREMDGGWELCRLSRTDGTPQTLCAGGSAAPLDRVTALSVTGTEAFVTGLLTREAGAVPAAVTYALPLDQFPAPDAEAEAPEAGAEEADAEPRITLFAENPPPAGATPVSALFGASSQYLLLSDGRFAVPQLSGCLYIPEQGGAVFTGASAAGGYLCLPDAATGTVYGGDLERAALYTVDTGLRLRAAAARSPQELAILAADAEKGDARLLLVRGGGTLTLDRLEAPFQTAIPAQAPALCLSFFAALCLSGLLVLLCRLLTYRRLAVRLVAGASFIVLLAVTALGVAGLFSGARIRAEALLEEAAFHAEERAGALTEYGLARLPQAAQTGGETLRGLLANRTAGGREAVFALYCDDGTGQWVTAVAGGTPSGLPISAACFPDVRALLLAAAQTREPAGTLFAEGGRLLSACALPLEAGGSVETVLLAVIPANALESGMLSDAARLGTALGVLFCCAVALLSLLTFFATRPLRSLTARMNEIAEGQTEFPPVRCGRDEVGRLWRSMQEMSVGLSIRDYETRNTIGAFCRFVPEGMEKLLGRASVAEVTVGDVVSMEGSLCAITVNNRERARIRLDNTQFVSFVNDCFDAVNDSVSAHQGMLLLNSFTLTSIKALFPASPDDGFAAALALLGEMRRRSPGEIPAPDFFQMLHRAPFLYGVAGAQDKAFPFLSSLEMDFLGRFADRFRSAGVRVVMTEKYLNSLSRPPQTRYIGFVSSQDSRYVYKLYEALEAYADTGRTLRCQYDAKFQEAIQLFYRNDFYLARNIFSSLLKTCPDDGVARWYLFACEHFFNCEDLDQVSYNLFGIEQ